MLPLVALVMAGCGGGEDPDVVVIGPDEPVQIRTLFSLTGASTFGEAVRASVGMAAADFRSIHGSDIELGPSLDSRALARWRARRRRAHRGRPAGPRGHWPIALDGGSRGLAGNQRSGAGDGIAVEHFAGAHVRSAGQCRFGISPRLLPHRQQRPLPQGQEVADFA